MRKTIRISPRRTGKSILAVYEFTKNPNETCFITFSNDGLEDILHKNPELKKYKHNFFNQNDNLIGRRFDRAVIDEYFLFSSKNIKSLYETIYLNGVKKVYVFGTLNGVLDKALFDFVKQCKIDNIKLSDSIVFGFVEKNKYLHLRREDLMEKLEWLYFNWVTDPDSDLIFTYKQYGQEA